MMSVPAVELLVVCCCCGMSGLVVGVASAARWSVEVVCAVMMVLGVESGVVGVWSLVIGWVWPFASLMVVWVESWLPGVEVLGC